MKLNKTLLTTALASSVLAVANNTNVFAETTDSNLTGTENTDTQETRVTQEEIDKSKQEVDAAKSEVDKTKSEITKIETYEKEVKDKIQALKVENAIHENAKEQLTEIEPKIDELTTKETELTETVKTLEGQVESEKEKVEDAKQVVESNKTEVESAKQKVEDKVKAIETVNAQLETKTEDKAKELVEEKKQSVQDATTNVEAKQTAVNDARTSDEALETRTSEARQTVEDRKQGVTDATNELIQAEKELNDILTQNRYPSSLHLSDEWIAKFKEHYAEKQKTNPDLNRLEALRQELMVIEEADKTRQFNAVKDDFSQTTELAKAWDDASVQTTGTIDISNLSEELKLELSQHVATLINDVRIKLGLEPLKVNTNLITFASKVADTYERDNRDNFASGHYVGGITEAAREMNLSDRDNYYENLSTSVRRAKLYTKDELFAEITNLLDGFFYEGYQNYGHTYSLLGMDTLGVDMSKVQLTDGRVLNRLHILSVPSWVAVSDNAGDFDARKTEYAQKYGKDSAQSVANTPIVTQEEKAQAKTKVEDAQIKLTRAEQSLTMAESRLEELVNTPRLTPQAEAELTNARRDLETAKTELAQAEENLNNIQAEKESLTQQLGVLRKELDTLRSDVVDKEQELFAAEQDLATKSETLRDVTASHTQAKTELTNTTNELARLRNLARAINEELVDEAYVIEELEAQEMQLLEVTNALTKAKDDLTFAEAVYFSANEHYLDLLRRFEIEKAIDDAKKNDGQDTGQDKGQDTGQDTGQDKGQDNGQDTGQDKGQDTGEDKGQDKGQDNGQDTGQDKGQDNGQDSGQDKGQDVVNDKAKDSVQDKVQETGKTIVQNAVNQEKELPKTGATSGVFVGLISLLTGLGLVKSKKD